MQVYQVLCVLICSYIVLVMTDVIPYQSSCSLSTNNGNCSDSVYCTCATLAAGGNVCTQQMNCDYSAECDTNDACEKDNSTCILDPRCPGKRLCYSYVLFSPELCPPMTSTGGGGN